MVAHDIEAEPGATRPDNDPYIGNVYADRHDAREGRRVLVMALNEDKGKYIVRRVLKDGSYGRQTHMKPTTLDRRFTLVAL